MANAYRKLRKLVRDPALFLADSRLLRQRVQVATAGLRSKGSKKDPNQSYLGNPIFPAGIDFVVYFPSKLSMVYQVDQWLPALRKLASTHTVVILTREEAVHRYFVKTTRFPVMYCRTLDDLMGFYERIDVGCVLYVNNAAKNFQSLVTGTSLHVHLNHGESEKASMHSNQAKAYDYVFVVAEAGRKRYVDNLIKLTDQQFIQVGRPQLDNISPIQSPASEGCRVVMYAPTWSAHHTGMNYSSIAKHGESIVDSFLGRDGYHLVYRPHPSVGTSDEDERLAHERILAKLETSENASLIADVDINRIFPIVDLGIFDNSSVLIDYLKVDRPFLVTNMMRNAELPRVFGAGHVLDASDYNALVKLCAEHISFDPKQESRNVERRYYLGEYAEGESTERFVSELERILAERHRLVATKLS